MSTLARSVVAGSRRSCCRRPRRRDPRTRRCDPRTRRSRAHCRSRAQVEPLAALAALFAVCVGLSLYTVVLVDVDRPVDRDLAGPTLTAVEDAVSHRGVVLPTRLDRAVDHAPSGRALNVTLATADRRWTVGPSPGPDGDHASRVVSVRVGPGRIRAGTLRVVVWR